MKERQEKNERVKREGDKKLGREIERARSK